MSSNVGLTTPRGSGTSGYVQRNLSHLRPRDAPYPSPSDYSYQQQKHRQRKPDQDILAHDRLREVEVQVFNLRDQLEEEGVAEEEIETRTNKLRKEMTGQGGDEDEEKEEAGDGRRKGSNMNKDINKKEVTTTTNPHQQPRLKPHQVHELAVQKMAESEKLRRALGIREDYEEGSHWRRGEEQRLAESLKPEEENRRRG